MQFFDGENSIKDKAVLQSMNRLLEADKLNNSNITRDEIYLTLIALYVLKNEFGDR